MSTEDSLPEEELLVGTYNMWEHGMYPDRPGEQDRYDLQVQIMKHNLPCQVWAVHEIGNVEAFQRLADRLGMDCAVGKPGEIMDQPVFDPGGRGFGVGVMWDPAAGISAVPGTRRIYTEDVFFHGVASIVLDAGDDLLLQIASGHATPWGFPQNFQEAKRWASIMTRPNRGLPGGLAEVVVPGALITDSNSPTGDQIQQPDGSWTYHAPDPMAGKKWFHDNVYQQKYPRVLDPATGKPIPNTDRLAGDVLWDAGLHDPSAVLNLPFTPTTGYHRVDPNPPRDLDHIRLTEDIRDSGAIVGVRVLDNKRVRVASDHKPKQARLKRSLLPRTRIA
ncbi:MAG TPA: hypothetical protein VGL46_09200 [Pseudonocardiaceae bacterium]